MPHQAKGVNNASFFIFKKDSRKGISFGAPSPNLFEHIYKVVSSIPIREMRKILAFFIDVNPNHSELLNQLTEEQLLLYWLSHKDDGGFCIA
jgi:hypothetical protein